jgi:hypothetical protein
MTRRRYVPHVIALVLSVLALEGCATRRVGVFVDRRADLSQYQRYDWGPGDRASTGDPRLDNNEIFQERVRAAVDMQLAAKGFVKSADSPELLVHYHASIEQRIDLRDAERSQPCPECKPFIYDEGTLVIDLVDARTRQLVWRGWSEGNVDGVIDNQRWMEERIDDAVTRIFENLPPRTR